MKSWFEHFFHQFHSRKETTNQLISSKLQITILKIEYVMFTYLIHEITFFYTEVLRRNVQQVLYLREFCVLGNSRKMNLVMKKNYKIHFTRILALIPHFTRGNFRPRVKWIRVNRGLAVHIMGRIMYKWIAQCSKIEK